MVVQLARSSAAPADDLDWKFVGLRTTMITRDALIRAAVEASYKVPGNIVEFGVADGSSTRVIRRTANRMERYYGGSSKKRIFACDSFEGLPEKYENAEVGAFACTPPKIAGVTIVKGYFEDSLTDDLAQTVGTVALASLDADLFSSTKCALDWLTPLLRTGSLLLFDEFLGDDAAERRAFDEWCAERSIRAIQIAYCLREPSGWGDKIDARALYQILSNEPLAPVTARWDVRSRAKSVLRQYPDLYGRARNLYRRAKGKKGER